MGRMPPDAERARRAVRVALPALLLLVLSSHASAWGNGGRSADSMNPDYGAHDWIAERAMRMLPSNESFYISENRARYLYATEIPDFVYEDQYDHHVYFNPDGSVMEDNAAAKAKATYDDLVSALRASDFLLSAEKAGVLTHYISDVAVFGHVLSSKTVWGAEKHHSDFEADVDEVMRTPDAAEFAAPSDGTFETRGAWEAAVDLARNTTFGDLTHTARWLDDHYVTGGIGAWDPAFRERIEALISLAANLIAEVLHIAALDASLPAQAASRAQQPGLLALFGIMAVLIVSAILLAVLLLRRRR